MSCLHNEAILETIFDEVMEELEAKEAFNPLLSREELEQTASTITQQRFEHLQ